VSGDVKCAGQPRSDETSVEQDAHVYDRAFSPSGIVQVSTDLTIRAPIPISQGAPLARPLAE
jgi:hypothetical protein